MRINRRFLYAGVFLVALGATLVAADLGALDLGLVREALRLSPIALVLIGLAIVVRRSPLAVPAGLLAATIPGLALGGAIAIGPHFVADCASPGLAAPAAVRQGSLAAGADVSVRIHCGSLAVTTSGTADGWTIYADDRVGPAPAVDAADGSLALSAVGVDELGPWGVRSIDGRRGRWQLALPSGDLGDVSATFLAAETTIDLADARVRSIHLTATASDVDLDLSRTFVSDVSVVSTFGQVTLYVPSGTDLSADLKVTGGRVVICTNRSGDGLNPVGLRVTGRGFAAATSANGDHQPDLDYQSPFYARATHHADVRVNASFGAVDIDPYVGGCK